MAGREVVVVDAGHEHLRDDRAVLEADPVVKVEVGSLLRRRDGLAAALLDPLDVRARVVVPLLVGRAEALAPTLAILAVADRAPVVVVVVAAPVVVVGVIALVFAVVVAARDLDRGVAVRAAAIVPLIVVAGDLRQLVVLDVARVILIPAAADGRARKRALSSKRARRRARAGARTWESR